MNQLEINLKSCEFLGYDDPRIVDMLGHQCRMVVYENSSGKEIEFNLFTNQADTLATVKMLGEQHKVDIISCGANSKEGTEWGYWDDCQTSYCPTPRTVWSYEEAVGSAVEAVTDAQ